MINKQNKHGPRDGLSQGIRGSRGSPPGVANSPPMHRRNPFANYPYLLIVKPPGQRSRTRKKWPRYDIVYGLPVWSQPVSPHESPPYTTQMPKDPGSGRPGETRFRCCKGRGMPFLNLYMRARGTHAPTRTHVGASARDAKIGTHDTHAPAQTHAGASLRRKRKRSK